jgi:hypothetical protein
MVVLPLMIKPWVSPPSVQKTGDLVAFVDRRRKR